MKYCSQCGRHVPKEARFCNKCGAVLPEHEVAAAAMEMKIKEQGKRSSGVKKATVLIGIAIVVLLVAGLGWRSFCSEARVQQKLELAVKYLNENNYDKAILAYNDCIRIEPKEVKAYQGLARTYTLQEDYENAKVAYERGVNIVSPENKLQLRSGLASMYIDKGDLTEAEYNYETIINDNKTYIDAYCGLALVYQQRGNKDKARAVLEQGVRENSQKYHLFNELAALNMENRDRDAALESIRQSLLLQVNQKKAFEHLGKLYRFKQEELIKLGNQYVLQDNALVGHLIILFTLNSQGKASEAIKHINQLPQNIRNNLTVKLIEAETYLNNGQSDLALQILNGINTSDVKDAYALARLAELYLDVGQKDVARTLAQKALKVDNKLVEGYMVLNRSYLDEDQIKAAIWRTRFLLFGSNASIKETRRTMNNLGIFLNSKELLDRLTFKQDSIKLLVQGLSEWDDGGIRKYNLSWMQQSYFDNQNNIAYVSTFFNGSNPYYFTSGGIVQANVNESLYRMPTFVRIHNPLIFYRDGDKVVGWTTDLSMHVPLFDYEKQLEESLEYSRIIAEGPPLETHIRNAGFSLDDFIFVDAPEQK